MSDHGVLRWNMMKSACPTRQVLDRIANKWTMLVIMSLEDKTLRFSELRSRIEGVSQKMLTQTLRGMESDGFVLRTVYPTVPVTVEYSLTDLGESLAKTVDVLRGWAYGHMSAIEDARKEYLARTETLPSEAQMRDAG
ncbi:MULTISPECIES: winged helix-turn-helix transcriptional regulator [Amycolatopsis]|uniref:Helix-turn-helix transcriptional regulator n=1 Tax=Amycolatopsis dendrobii TaxID=2760662 RepID=A0A7W3VWN6_9PSEU|nr:MULTISPECIES: helix-turn-helix domain-containing protein [Amycolatopsis]MBB1154441.1 helix-turn-helix transcriptional regulator [Amycolatopsis dendrobii]UKD51184.1 helix-turn-helix transcriptional regulator [Amycolatopsis sp. FU40]